MKMLYLTCVAVGCMTLSGCVVHDHHRRGMPSAKVVVPVPVVIEGAKPCPPGQAKKGRC